MDHRLKLGVTQFLCLGDVIGYGPDPLAVKGLLRKFQCVADGESRRGAGHGKNTGLILAKPRAPLIGHGGTVIAFEQRHSGASWFKERTPSYLKGKLTLVHGSIYDPVHDHADEPEKSHRRQCADDRKPSDGIFPASTFASPGTTRTQRFMATKLGVMRDSRHDATAPSAFRKGHKAYVRGQRYQPRDRDPR
jgi:hypothetical protein